MYMYIITQVPMSPTLGPSSLLTMQHASIALDNKNQSLFNIVSLNDVLKLNFGLNFYVTLTINNYFLLAHFLGS